MYRDMKEKLIYQQTNPNPTHIKPQHTQPQELENMLEPNSCQETTVEIYSDIHQLNLTQKGLLDKMKQWTYSGKISTPPYPYRAHV